MKFSSEVICRVGVGAFVTVLFVVLMSMKDIYKMAIRWGQGGPTKSFRNEISLHIGDRRRDVSLKHVDYRNKSFYVGEVHWSHILNSEPHVMQFVYDSITMVPAYHVDTSITPLTPDSFSDPNANMTTESRGHDKRHRCLFVDVGMNDGFYTQMVASLGCRVISFEIQSNCISIAENAARLNRCRYKPCSLPQGLSICLRLMLKATILWWLKGQWNYSNRKGFDMQR